MRRIDPRDVVKIAEATYLESLLIHVLVVDITSNQHLVLDSIKWPTRRNSPVKIKVSR